MGRTYDKVKFREEMYGGLAKKTIRNMLIRELIENFGYSDKLAIAETLVDRFLSIINDATPPIDRVKPGQMVWLGVDVDDFPAQNKTLEMTRLRPVILTVTNEDDLKRARNGEHPRKFLPDVIARMMCEAFDQGAVLSQYDVSVVSGRCLAYVGNAIRRWQREHGRSLPSRGSIHDLGSAVTHKKEIVGLYLQGYKTSEISKKTQHHPESVDRYIKDFKRVLYLHNDKKEASEIAFYTRLSESLVREYLVIIANHKDVLDP